MKHKLLLFIILFPALTIAQTTPALDSLAKVKLNELIDSWTMGIDTIADVVDIRVYNKFKSLFDLNATIDDDFNAFYQYNKGGGLYKIDRTKKAFDDYAHDVALQIKSLAIDTIVHIDSSTRDENNMTFTIKRSVHFEKPRKYVLSDSYNKDVISSRAIAFEDRKDSLKMAAALDEKITKNQDVVYKFTMVELLHITMALKTDTVRIMNITSTITDLRCTNDLDLDAIINAEDTLPNTFGDFTANGTPDFDLDGVPDSTDKCQNTYGYLINHGCPPSYFFTRHDWDAFIGLQLQSLKLNLPELNQLGYVDQSGKDGIDVLQSKKGTLKNPGAVATAYAGGNYTFYFGQKRRKIGISVGITYSGLSAEYALTEPIVYTFKSFDGVNAYRRQITISSLTEAISSNIYNFPVMLTYRFHLDRKNKSVINVKAGPSFMLFTNLSNYNAMVDFGGLYQVDTIRKNAITYYDYFDRGSTYNVFFTSESINARNQNTGANTVFEQLAAKTYDFASNKMYTGRQTFNRMTAAFNFNLNLQRKISEGLTVEAGVHFVYAPKLAEKEKYRPLDKTNGQFQSLYNSNAKAAYTASGANIGFVYNF